MYSFLPYRIGFGETDAMGIVHHSNHNRFFERGRIEYLRQIGILYSELSDAGVHFPVLRTECRYRQPLQFDANILIESHVSMVSKTRLVFAYRIYVPGSDPEYKFSNSPFKESGLTPATTGISEHCCLAPDGKPQRIPSELLDKFVKYTAGDRK